MNGYGLVLVRLASLRPVPMAWIGRLFLQSAVCGLNRPSVPKVAKEKDFALGYGSIRYRGWLCGVKWLRRLSRRFY